MLDEGKIMKLTRILIHGIALAMINLASVIAGFFVYAALRPINQSAIQLPTGLLFNTGLFLIWFILSRHLFRGALALRKPLECFWVTAAALLWSPLLFYPLHFMTQGYLSAWSNIAGLWIYQLFVNAILLLIMVGLFQLPALRTRPTPGEATQPHQPNLA